MEGIIEKALAEVRRLSEAYGLQAADGYDFWQEHVRYVQKRAVELAEAYGAELETVRLAALLHDIALMAQVGTRAEHHINGAEMARKMLCGWGYPQEKAERVAACVLSHRSSKNARSLEALCVADADILAHFDNIPMLFHSAFVRGGMRLGEARARMRESFQADYEDLSERTKAWFSARYEVICEVVLGNPDCR